MQFFVLKIKNDLINYNLNKKNYLIIKIPSLHTDRDIIILSLQVSIKDLCKFSTSRFVDHQATNGTPQQQKSIRTIVFICFFCYVVCLWFGNLFSCAVDLQQHRNFL